MNRSRTRLASIVATAAMMLALGSAVWANGIQVDIHLGRTWSAPENDGDAANVFLFPAGIPIVGKTYVEGADQDFKRGWLGIQNKGGTYLWSTNWTAPDAVVWPNAGSYFFRSMNYDYPAKYLNDGLFNYLYPVGLQEYMRWERPKLYVVRADTTIDFKFHPGPDWGAGLELFVYPSSGGKGPRPDIIIDPTLVTEKTLFNSWRYIQGVELQRTTYGWGYGTQHQDYIVHDMVLTNNGISGRKLTEWPFPPDDPPVLTNQTLTGVVWARSHDWRTTAAAGGQRGKDEEAMYVQPWGNPGHHVTLSYDLDAEDVDGPDWGDPGTAADYGNIMMSAGYGMYGPLFVSAGPGADYNTDDLEQPAFRTVWYERGLDMHGSAPYFAAGDVAGQRALMVDGNIHLATDESYRDNAFTAAIADNASGPTSVIGYGKLNGDRTTANIDIQGWTLGWEESIRIVNINAASGIDVEPGREIGAKWNAHKTNADPVDTWMSAEDIALVQSGLDSVNKAAAMAYWNYYGTFAANVTPTELAKWGVSDYITTKPSAYNQQYNSPDAPRPPEFLAIYARAQADGGGIIVRWGKAAETAPDHDTGVLDFAKYRIYRQEATRLAPFELMVEAPADMFIEQAASTHHTVEIPGGRFWIDDEVTPGTDYWYTVVAVDDGTQNWAQPGRALESTRWWTWGGYSTVGVTAIAAGDVVAVNDRPNRFSLEQNAPNPFNPSTTIRFSVDMPGATGLAIYNASGQVVRTLVNGNVAVGSHEIVWDGADASGRPVASGVYIYRLTNGDRQLQKRMVLVR